MNSIKLKTNKSLNNYICTNPKGQTVNLGNDGNAVGPMESVLMAIASCSSIDIVMILEKMKQDLQDIEVEVTGKRAESPPRVSTQVKAHYKLYGEIKDKKAHQAVQSSIEKYCSVALMVSKTAEIEWSYEVISK